MSERAWRAECALRRWDREIEEEVSCSTTVVVLVVVMDDGWS